MSSDSCNTLDTLIAAVGRTAERLVALDSCEGAAGNLSIFFRLGEDVEGRFPLKQ